ncbi:MAG: GGDEF domain-containing protein [Spirochaetales bacterium]|nr:GGDEF domain-containing protein [Spirochaetales bacterium]
MKNPALTFGIVIDWPDLGNSYQKSLVYGIRTFAAQHNINLITFATGRIDSSHSWEKPRDLLFNFIANNELFSGFLLFSSSLSSLSSTERLAEKLSGLTTLPAVSIGTELEGYPSVVVDNRTGFEELVEHMVIHHGYRDIAYISGPLKHAEGRQRWEIFKEVCTRQRITIPESHFFEGNFAMNSGAHAMKYFLDEKGIMPEAIIAANDNMAIGAWEVLIKRNIQVPKQIALTGFDDLQISESFDLPFTTVRQPLAKQGYLAAETLYELIQGKQAETLISLPSEVVYRFSCGCLTGKTRLDTAQANDPLNRDAAFISEAFSQFKEAINLEFQGKKGFPVIRCWNKIILSAIETGIRESILFDLLELIQQEYSKDHYSKHQQSTALSFTNQMKHMVNEFYIQSDLLKRMMSQASDREIVNNIENVGVDPENKLNLYGKLSTIQNILDLTDTRHCYISLFNNFSYSRDGSSKLIFAARDGKGIEIPAQGIPFPTAMLTPEEYRPQQRFDLLYELLFDYDNIYGLIGLDMNASGPDVFEMVRIRMSAIIRAHLAQQNLIDLNRQLQHEINVRQETEKRLQQALNALQDLSLTDELTGLYNRRGFITMGEQQLKYCQRENEPFIVFFIDMDGLKKINDHYGHNEGDSAIRLTGEILKKSFRDTDIIARLGGDEFTVFAAKADEESVAILKRRIENNLQVANAQIKAEYTLSMSIGTCLSGSLHHSGDFSLDEMLQEADRELYEAKRLKKK